VTFDVLLLLFAAVVVAVIAAADICRAIRALLVAAAVLAVQPVAALVVRHVQDSGCMLQYKSYNCMFSTGSIKYSTVFNTRYLHPSCR
jgi:nitrogen fixation/metabolism regulation signal transduction histidine kinase